MSLSKLAATFRGQAAANNNNITINAASFTDSELIPQAGLDDLLSKSYQLPADTFLLIDISGTSIPEPVGNTLTITNATAAILNVEKSNTSVTLIVTANDANEVQFTIQINLANWIFATSWKYMTGGVFDNLPYTSPSFIFSTQEVTVFNWKQKNISLTEGQNFASFITLTQWLQPVVNFFTSWSLSTQLALVGSIDPSQVNNEDIVYPELDLLVNIDATLISLGFLKVSNPGVGFQIKTEEETITPEPDDEEEALRLEDEVENGLILTTDETEKVQTPILYFRLLLEAGDAILLNFTAGVESGSSSFTLDVTSDPQKPLTPLNLFGLMAGQNWFQNIPPTLQQYLNSIAFKGFNTCLDFSNGLSITSVSAYVGSNGAWTLFDNFVIEQFDVNWLIIGPGTTNSQSLYFSARVNFFPSIFVGGFDVEITSDLALSAAFVGSVTFNNLLSAITGGAISIPENLLLVEFTSFGINMDINSKYYEFYANANIDLNFITNVSVTDGSLRLTSSSPASGTGPSIFTAQVSGLFAIGSLQLNTDVNYNSSDGWDLSLAMPAGNTLNLGELIKQLFQTISLPTSFLPDSLSITQFSLDATIPSGTGQSSYEVKGGLQWIFTFPIIDQKINIIANLWLKYEAASNDSGTGKYSGGVLGSVTLDYFNATVGISYNFSDNNQQLAITWEGFTAMYDVSGESRTIVFSIKNWTLGGLITSFMKMLFNPTFELDAPWDILDKISLDGFSVTYNLDTKDIKVTYKLPKTLNLVFININGINLTKTQAGVFITFDGNSVVPSINESNLFKPASGGQDIQKMPDVPGQGNQYFDLRLLAMGQHVELANPAQYNSIKDVTKAMQEAFTEPKPGTVPIGPGSGNTLLKFNEDSNWLIATNFGILNAGTKDKPVWTLDMQVVFNDPNLYGLRIAMAGGKAKIFEGLDFEIMYKKISDSIGVYQIDLTLPNALRYLQFGAINITLPSIGVEIYTNGDFMVDIGFPYNMDFSRSFTLQAIVPPGIPAMGSGGFYFGKLSSATTNKVPKTNYGNFNPVIVFGIGLQVGVGYSVNYGILSAGFSITMFGVIEGVIAAYYPYSGALQESNKEKVESSYYYYLQGTIGIIGKLYGSIDFGIISASVNITVMLYAQATFEAYNKIPLAIVASVDVRVSAKLNLGIFSITIHFTFTAKIRFDLTIGTDQTAQAPWNNNLGAPNTAARVFSPAATVRIAPARIATPLDGAMPVSFAEINAFETIGERSLNQMVIRRSPHIPINYSSILTTTSDSEETLPTLSLYFVPHLTVAGPENGNLKDQTAQYVATLFIDAPDPSGNNGYGATTSFEYLCSDFFRWLVLNYIDHTPSQSTRTEIDTEGISKADLDALISFLSSENNPFPIPTSDLLSFLQNTFQAINIQLLESDLPSAAIFPMFFDLELKVPNIALDIQFNNYNMATQEYLSAVKEWFNQLAVKVQEETANTTRYSAAADPQQWSMSTFVFEDYFVLLGKQLSGYASDAMDNFTYRLNNGNSLSAMVNWANNISVDGTSNHVNIQDVATANQTHPLTGNTPIVITGVMHDIVEGDTFASVSAIYAITATMLITENATVPGILAPQTITYNGNSYDVKTTDTITTVASGLQTTVGDLAADINFQNTALLTENSWLIIGAAIYTAKNEDTFNSISTIVYKNIDVIALLLQNQITQGLFIAGNSFEYNTTKYTIVPGDTLTSMAAAISILTGTTVTNQDLANNTQVQEQQVQPLGQVLIQPFIHTTVTFTDATQADTLDALAQQYNTTASLLAINYANQQQNNLFYNGEGYTNANIPGLQYLTVESILEYFDDNNSYGQLSGMVSRYQLHGMRLPTNLPGLTLSEDSPCTGSNCALYALTGQEFALPATIPDDFSIQLINNSLSWLQFNGKTIQNGGNTLDITLTDEDINQVNTLLTYAQQTGIQPEIIELAPMQPFDLQPVQYTFQTTTKWQTSGALKLPYGSAGDQSNVSPLIWQFPSGLLNQLALPKVEGSEFSIQIGQYDSAKGVMDYWPSSYYGWSTMVDIEIKLLDTDSTATVNAYSYELLGASEADTNILQRLLLALDPKSSNNNTDKILDIQWLYEGSDGLLSVGMEQMKTFIVQSNLSTETNPSTSLMKMSLREEATVAHTTGVLNSFYDFIRLLWECSITRSGGYYLMYNETESNNGFPSSVFGKGDNANVRLLVTYSNQYNNKPTDYMTCGVTGDKIDANSCVVYAQSEMQEGLSYNVDTPDETINTITAKFNILPTELVELNKTVNLNTKADTNDPNNYPVPIIIFNGLVCEVGTNGPGNTLASIASYYELDSAAIQQLNPDINDWNNLPLWQLIMLPQVQYTISTNDKAGITFETIAAYYFIDMAAMAWAAKDVVNIFVNPTILTINDQILHKVTSVQQGTAGFDLNRKNPNPDPNNQPKITDPNYAEVYLNNMYNLLSYQVVENSWFIESIVGLPAGPAKPQTQDNVLGKTDDSNNQDDLIWYYNQIVPIAKFAKSNPFMIYPADYPQEADNPYRGIGHPVQLHFDWVDYYGNVTVTPFSDPQLDAATPINNPPIQTGYVDELKGLGKWPSVELSYIFDLDINNEPELKLEFNFNIQRYNELPDVPADQQQDWKQNAANDLLIYTNIYYQLTQLNPVDGKNTLTATLSTSLTPNKTVNLSDDQFNQLLQFVKDIYTYLSARSLGNEATAPVTNPLTNPINVVDIDTHSILQLTVNLDFYRDLQYVNTDFKDSILVTSAITQVKPKTISTQAQTDSDSQYSLNEFAVLFETAFFSADNYELKIAIGTNAATAGGANSQAVFVVRMGLKPGQGIYWQVNQAGTYQLTTESIAQLTADEVPSDVTTTINTLVGNLYESRDLFDSALLQQLTIEQFNQYRINIYTYSLLNAVFYAPKPLATSLISKGGVPVCNYITGQGLDCSKGEVQTFTGIDMDTWGAQSLNAIDVFLSADYSIPAFLVDQLKSDEEKDWLATQGINADTYLQAITNAKTTLANAIASEVEPILTAPYVSSAMGDNTSMGNAKEKFEQQLLNQLGNAYTVNALIQFEVTAESDFTASGNYQTPPRLYGTPVINNVNGDSKEYSISTSKIQLNEKDATDTDSFLTFSFTTKDAKEFTSVDLDMTYVVTHVECDISEVPGINGYLGSNWLTFIIPADVNSNISTATAATSLQQSLGNVDIPIVLRNYPTPPTLTTQTGKSVSVGGDTTKTRLAKASEWNFTYSYTEDQAAQDKIFSDIEFNIIPNSSARFLGATSRDLFSDLAQFVTVWPQVLDDFNLYMKLINAQSDSSDSNLANAYYALQTMVTLTNNLAIAWSQFNGLLLGNPYGDATARAYDFIIRQTDDIDFDNRLLITIVPASDMSADDLSLYRGSKSVLEVELPETPYVTIDNYTKVNATDKNGVLIPNAYWYQAEDNTYLSWEESFNIPSRTVNTDALNVLQFQYAWAGLSVIRNEDLVPYNPTVNDFIYRTPLVRFSNKLIPLLSSDEVFDVAKVNNDNGLNLSLAQQLANFFSTFFTYDDLAEQLVKLSVSWNYPLLASSGDLMPAIELPVLLAAPFTFEIPIDYEIPAGGCQPTFSESDPFVCRLANALKMWYSQHKPVTNGAWFQMEIAVFSSLSESKLPLITLSNIVLYYKNISDMNT